jgi:hypothetical protein
MGEAAALVKSPLQVLWAASASEEWDIFWYIKAIPQKASGVGPHDCDRRLCVVVFAALLMIPTTARPAAVLVHSPIEVSSCGAVREPLAFMALRYIAGRELQAAEEATHQMAQQWIKQLANVTPEVIFPRKSGRG